MGFIELMVCLQYQLGRMFTSFPYIPSLRCHGCPWQNPPLLNYERYPTAKGKLLLFPISERRKIKGEKEGEGSKDTRREPEGGRCLLNTVIIIH